MVRNGFCPSIGFAGLGFCRRASEADAEFDELPLLCWALDVDIDTLLLDGS